jgi:hypothetical protein
LAPKSKNATTPITKMCHGCNKSPIDSSSARRARSAAPSQRILSHKAGTPRSPGRSCGAPDL